jgi:cytochrome b
MKTGSAFRSEGHAADARTPREQSPAGAAATKILVWDAPVRVFHWLMVLCFAGAWLTAESERWTLVHVTLGYTMAGLVLFRLMWGVAGTRYARFGAFVRSPKAVLRYVAALLRGQPQHQVGHNPAGAVAVLVLLALTWITAGSGWAAYREWGGGWVGEMHEGAANLMLAMVLAHVGGVIVSSWLHRENLVLAMVSGHKTGAAADGIRSAWRAVAALMLVAVFGFWWLQWRAAPSWF